MQTVRIYRLTHLSPTMFGRHKAAQMEAAPAWNSCCELHRQALTTHSIWPGQDDLQQATKGRFALHSQSVQMVAQAFVATIDATRQLCATHPKMCMKYPWKSKRFYPVHWPAQTVSKERGRVVLPIGRGRASIVLPLDLPEHSGACTLVWNRGFELHVCIEVPQAKHAPGTNRATVDLGEIHLAAVTTNTRAVLVVSGRGIRSLKRQHNMRHRHLAKKQAHCQKYSKRWKKLQRARNKMAGRIERWVRDLRHKATRQVLDFCVEQQVGTLLIGNRMACARRTKDGITTSVWHSGSTAVISTISRTKVHKPASKASLARNEEQAASVRYVGINTNQEAECGSAGTVGSWGIVTW